MKSVCIRRLFFCILAVTLLAGAFAVLPQGHAHAATRALLSPSCSGDGCTGLDPQSTGCSAGAQNVAGPVAIYDSHRNLMGSVVLRYSSSCGTNWATVTSNIGVTTIEAEVTRVYDGHKEFGYSNQYSQVWSNMVYAPDVPAFGTGCVWSKDGSTSYCTDTPSA